MTNPAKNSPPYLGFGFAGVGTALSLQIPNLLLLVYMTDTLAISAALAGAALFAPRLLDVATDPLMGLVSDRTHSRWGRRRPYFLLGALVTGLALALLFNCPDFESVPVRLAYVVGFYVLMQLGVTIFMVPYYALPAELSSDPHERTKLMSCRAAFSFCGGLLGGALAPQLIALGGGGPAGYSLMSVVIGCICGAAFASAFFGTRRARLIERETTSPSIIEQFQVALGNRPFRIFMLGFIAYLGGFGCFVASIPYYAGNILGQDEILSTVWLAVNLPALASIPLWTLAARRWEKHQVLAAALGLMALTSCALFLGQGELSALLLTAALLGVGFGGSQVACWAMLPDIIQWDYAQSGVQRGGIFAGCMTAFEKTGLACGGLLTGALLGATGYVESTTGDAVQPASALTGVRLAIGAAPAALYALAAALMAAYPLTHKLLRAQAEAL